MVGLYLGYVLTEPKEAGHDLPVMTVLLPAVDYIALFSSWLASGLSSYHGILELDNMFTYAGAKMPEGTEFDDYIKRKIKDRGVLNIALMNISLFLEDENISKSQFNILAALNGDDVNSTAILKPLADPRAKLILYSCPYFNNNKLASPVKLSDKIQIGDKLRIAVSKIIEERAYTIPLFKQEEINKILCEFYSRLKAYPSSSLATKAKMQNQLSDELREIIERSASRSKDDGEASAKGQYIFKSRAG